MEDKEVSKLGKGSKRESSRELIVLFTGSILLGITGLFPIGICRLATEIGFVDIFSRLGKFGTVFGIGTLLAILVYGISKVPNAEVLGWLLLLLALLNLGGCAVMLDSFKGVH